jgi:hypothetical protein
MSAARSSPTGGPGSAPWHRSDAKLPTSNPQQRDKGYHSNEELVDLEAVGVRSYISEPDRGRRKWKKNPEARDVVYRNRRRIVARAASDYGDKR